MHDLVSCNIKPWTHEAQAACNIQLSPFNLGVLWCGQAQKPAARWQQRCEELQSRYDKVDMKEHQLVLEELGNAKQLIATHQQEAQMQAGELKELQAKVGSPCMCACGLRRLGEHAQAHTSDTHPSHAVLSRLVPVLCLLLLACALVPMHACIDACFVQHDDAHHLGDVLSEDVEDG